MPRPSPSNRRIHGNLLRLAAHGRGEAHPARAEHPLRTGGDRGARLRRMDGGRLLPPRADRDAGGELLGRDPAAQRHRRPPHGPRAERLGPGRAGPPQPDARQEHALDPRHRPRRHRHPGESRERASAPKARPARSSAARPSSSASGPGKRSTARRSSSSTSASAPPATTSASASPSTRATSAPSTKSSSALYDKGYVYRDNYMVNWDPGTRSAISDLEVENRDVDRLALLHRLPGRGLRRGAHGRHGAPGDDARRHRGRREPRRRALRRTWSASTAILPLVGRRLPIIADDYVDPEFGTGALKITPGHDINDFEIGRKPRAHGDRRDRPRRADERGGRRLRGR